MNNVAGEGPRCCHDTSNPYAEAAAFDGKKKAEEALERIRRFERALAGDLEAKRAIFEQMQEEIAAVARPKRPAPTIDDFLKQAYSPEQVRLAGEKAGELLDKMFAEVSGR